MKFAAAILFLPTLALAQSRAKFTGEFRTSGNGCPRDSVSVVLGGEGEAANEVAEVSLRNYRVELGGVQNLQCQVFLDIRFPTGCRRVSFNNTLTGPFQLDPGATGTYQRAFILPSAQNISPPNGNRPADLRFVSSPGVPDYIQNDQFSASLTIGTGAPNVVPYSLEGSLSLQRGPNNNANGSLANNVWAVSIASQTTCCKSLTQSPREC